MERPVADVMIALSSLSGSCGTIFTKFRASPNNSCDIVPSEELAGPINGCNTALQQLFGGPTDNEASNTVDGFINVRLGKLSGSGCFKEEHIFRDTGTL